MTSHCHCGAQPVAVDRDFQEAEALVVLVLVEVLVAPVAPVVLVVLVVLVVDEVEGVQDSLVGLVSGRC